MFLLMGIILSVSALGYYKYYDFLGTNISYILKVDFSAKNILLPLGISFFTFKAISYFVDIYKGKVIISKNPIYAANYLSFFGQIESGPISRFSSMNPRSIAYRNESKEKWTLFTVGVFRFVVGLCKKVLISNLLGNIVSEVFSTRIGDTTQAFLWLGALSFSLQLFFDFSGYSDMAIGITQMFGFECPENFNYPYITKSVSEFWRRWHMTLGLWFRDYIYIPLGGSHVGKGRLLVNLFVVWLCTGIWHGANWTFIFWGFTYFVVIAFEKLSGWPEKLPKVIKWIYRILVLFFINFEWVMFRSSNIHDGLSYIKHMFISVDADRIYNQRTLFLLNENKYIFIIALVLCVPVFPWIEKKISSN